ncbi:MAG: M20/M25/M40 family metallo-hydrolase [Candidatus Schekmanbacteria bacterium]|nr:M20/M25/M40 family metallo-hydrolase [Candidatus Schekmanbacteria bacterium]
MTESETILRQLSDAIGVPGFEDEVRSVIRGLIAPVADEVRTDVLGNLIATRRGRAGFKLMLDAHMDEVGLMVSAIDSGGFLRFATLGGWDVRDLPAHGVTIVTRQGERVFGIVGTRPIHITPPEDRTKAIPLDDLYIDIGARDAAEVAAMGVRIGDPAVIHYPFRPLGTRQVVGKAFDDRAGCAVAIRVLEALAGVDLNLDLACCFSVSEEVGARGAPAAAYDIQPDLALALEGTMAADTPGVPEARQPAQLGKGPVITIADSSVVVPRRVVEALERAAEEEGVTYQYKRPIYGGTNAGPIQRTRTGVPVGVVSVPCRYLHTPLQLLRLDDFDATVALVTRFVASSRAQLG